MRATPHRGNLGIVLTNDRATPVERTYGSDPWQQWAGSPATGAMAGWRALKDSNPQPAD